VLGTLAVTQLAAEVKSLACAHSHALGGEASPSGVRSRTRAPPGALMRRCEHAGNLNAAPPLWCFTVVRAAPKKPTKAPPLTMLSSVESAQGRVVAFSVPPGAHRRGFPFGIRTREPTKPPLGKPFPAVPLRSQDGAPAALSRHRLVVARHRVHLFAAVCPCTYTRMHSLAGGLPRRHRYPSRNAAELEPHPVVAAAPLLGIGHPNFDADLLCSTTTSLSLPLLFSLWFSPVARSEV
jgi:hypothetical protein